MTRRMLINAQNPEELRIAIADGGDLETYKVRSAERGLTRGNIYRGRIANIQPSLNAAFIDYGEERHGFLAIQDVVPEAYYHQPKGGGRRRIDEVLEKGKPIVVQVVKEAEGQKGAALTTNLSLAGRYLVLTPFDNTRGVSRKVEDDDSRKGLKKIVAGLSVPDGCGVIVRTNALDQNKAALTRDLNALLRVWKRIATAARKGKGSALLYSDQDLILQALRDHLDNSVSEVLVDDADVLNKVDEYLRAFLPRTKIRTQHYTDKVPLFARYKVEEQVDRIYDRRVPLPSGGGICIDPTEALIAIDVNSGKATKAASQEETAVATNVEAAAEVGRQLRLRDLGGLVVVDFIDMRAAKNRRKVEKAMRDAMKADKARSSVGRISSNGLLEINRQRIQQALHLHTQGTCPTCNGTGRIASVDMVGLQLLRRIAAQAGSRHLKKALIHLHPEVANAFQNARRKEILALERDYEISIEILGTPGLHRRQQEIEWEKGESRPSRAKAPKQAKVSSSLLIEQGPLPADDDDDEDGSGSPRKRRRRGRRRGRGRTEEMEAAETNEVEQDDLEADGDDDNGANGSGRSRGRRRRGRRGGTRRGAASEERTTDGETESLEDEDDEFAPRRRSARRGARGDDEDRSGARRGRRRGGRARDDDEETTAEPKRDDDSDDEQPTARRGRRRGARAWDDDGDETAGETRRRGRRRSARSEEDEDEEPRRATRRGRRGRAADVEADSEAEEDRLTLDEDGDDDAPSRPRRRRSRRTAKATDADAEAEAQTDDRDGDDDDDPPSRPRRRRSRRTAKATDTDAETEAQTEDGDSDDDDAPSRPRRRRSRRTAKATDATAEGQGDDSEATPDDDAQRTPRRRSRRTSRSAASEAADTETGSGPSKASGEQPEPSLGLGPLAPAGSDSPRAADATPGEPATSDGGPADSPTGSDAPAEGEDDGASRWRLWPWKRGE